jgi:hypothetical protein
MPQLDPAIIAAAIGARQSYEQVARAVAEHQESGAWPLPGTLPYNAIVAWRAATHAIQEERAARGRIDAALDYVIGALSHHHTSRPGIRIIIGTAKKMRRAQT